MTRNIWIRRNVLERLTRIDEIHHKVHDDGSYESVHIMYYSYSDNYDVTYRFNKKTSNDLNTFKKFKNIITKKFKIPKLNIIYEKFNLNNNGINFINSIDDFYNEKDLA